MIGAHIGAPRWLDDAMPGTVGARVRVLGERDGRPHVVLLPGDSARSAPVVAKHYADDSGTRAATSMQIVRAELATLACPPLAVPEATAWHPRARVLVQSVCPGRPLLTVLRSPSWRHAAIAAGRALACLHALARGAGRVTTLVDHLRELVHPTPATTAAAVPALASRILEVDRALLSHTWSDPPTPVPIHRDAHARQMTLDGSRVWLMDWDLFAHGDAALDVANFAVYLHTHLGRRGPAARALFLDTYGAVAPAPMARLPIYTALTYLRLVSKACRRRPPGWARRAERYLARAEEALADAPGVVPVPLPEPARGSGRAPVARTVETAD